MTIEQQPSPKRRRGRPSKPLHNLKRAAFQTRIRGSLKQRLQASADEHGYSLSEEIERRLEDSYSRVESLFGGRVELGIAQMLYANFCAAGQRQAGMLGHSEWMPAEWMSDTTCFEQALEALVFAVWQHHPKTFTHDDFGDWVKQLRDRCAE